MILIYRNNSEVIVHILRQKLQKILTCRLQRVGILPTAGPSKQALARGESSFLQERRVQISED